MQTLSFGRSGYKSRVQRTAPGADSSPIEGSFLLCSVCHSKTAPLICCPLSFSFSQHELFVVKLTSLWLFVLLLFKNI